MFAVSAVTAAPSLKERAEAVQAIRNAGGDPSRGFGRRHLSLKNTPLSDHALVHLAELPTLADLNLCETNLGNEGLSHLKHCQGLQVIGVSATLVNDVGLAHLAQLPNLHILDLSDTIVGDAGIEQLGRFDRFTQLGLARSWC